MLRAMNVCTDRAARRLKVGDAAASTGSSAGHLYLAVTGLAVAARLAAVPAPARPRSWS
jgi:hypothetical protein